MKNIERMCTVAKGAEAFELAIVMFEIQSEKKKKRFIFVEINSHIINIIYTTVNIVLTEA